MAGMGYYMGSLQGQSAIDMARWTGARSTDYLRWGCPCSWPSWGPWHCMLMGAFARDPKSAQTLTMPITFLAMVPFFIMMMKDSAPFR